MKVGIHVTSEASPGQLVAGYDHAKIHNHSCRRRLVWDRLLRKAGTRTARCNGDCDDGRDESVRLVYVQHLEAKKGYQQRQQRNDDDAGIRAHSTI